MKHNRLRQIKPLSFSEERKLKEAQMAVTQKHLDGEIQMEDAAVCFLIIDACRRVGRYEFGDVFTAYHTVFQKYPIDPKVVGIVFDALKPYRDEQ